MTMTVTNLRRCLLESDYDSKTVASRIGISDTLMSEFVCGHRPIRPIYHLLNLAQVLNRKPSELLGVTHITNPTDKRKQLMSVWDDIVRDLRALATRLDPQAGSELHNLASTVETQARTDLGTVTSDVAADAATVATATADPTTTTTPTDPTATDPTTTPPTT